MSFRIKRPISPEERILVKRVHDAETLIARLFHENQVLHQQLTRPSLLTRLRIKFIWVKIWWASVLVKFTRKPKEAANG